MIQRYLLWSSKYIVYFLTSTCNKVINDKIKCSHSINTIMIIPRASYDLLLKLKKKVYNRAKSSCDVGAVEVSWTGLGNAVGALPVECEMNWFRCGDPFISEGLGQCHRKQQKHSFDAW